MDSDRNQGVDRRDVLRTIGTAGALGTAGSLSVSVAAADGTEDPVKTLEGIEKIRLAIELAREPEFELLLTKAQQMGYDIVIDPHHINAAETRTENFNRDTVAFQLKGTEENKQAGIVLSRTPSTSGVEHAVLEVEEYDSDGLFTRSEQYRIPSKASPSVATAAPNDIDLEKTVVDPSDETVDSLVRELDPNADVGTQDLGPDIPDLPTDKFNVNSCSGCYYASKVLCRRICGAVGTYACISLGIVGPASIGCVTFVKIVCYVAEKATGCGDDLAATICKSSGIGVCGPNEDGDIIDMDIPYV